MDYNNSRYVMTMDCNDSRYVMTMDCIFGMSFVSIDRTHLAAFHN
jgi:hypothetical protein